MQSVLHQSAFSYFAVNGFYRLFVMLVRMMSGNVILLSICMSSGIRMSASSTYLLQNSIQVLENQNASTIMIRPFYNDFYWDKLGFSIFFLISDEVCVYSNYTFKSSVVLYCITLTNLDLTLQCTISCTGEDI